jgi:RNA polymerase sigma-70 factor (ECF subfamily)
MARHEAAVFRFGRAIAQNDSDAEDALQETFLGAWRGAATFRGDGSARNWLLTIMRNAVHRQHRLRVDEPARMESLSDLGIAAGWGEAENPETIALRRESAGVFTHAVEQLAASDREILLLRDVEGFSGDDVATMLGLTLPAMKTRLHRARLRMAAKVREIYEPTR